MSELFPGDGLCPVCKQNVHGAWTADRAEFLPNRGNEHALGCAYGSIPSGPDTWVEGDYANLFRDPVTQLKEVIANLSRLPSLFDILTATQTRCTALIQEVRALKWLKTSSPVESRVLADVVHERRRQDEKWGPLDEKTVDMPDGTSEERWSLALHKARQANADGTESFLSILREEVYEAAIETDQEGLRGELVQVAAVALKWIQAIDMRKARIEGRADGLDLGGWWCGVCGAYNGPGRKDPTCRACEAVKPV